MARCLCHVIGRLQLAKVMKTGGNLLLLDEPTNDLDVDTLRAPEDAIQDFAGAKLNFNLLHNNYLQCAPVR
jgi:ABC-type multidrug transport system ATPase subunit